MNAYSLRERLGNNEYPGRGIILGLSGSRAVMAYFTMGRSENSRNRVFVKEGEGIRNKAFDPSKLTDPSLVIYAPVRVLGNATIVTNGDQTDTVFESLQAGKTFEEALRTRTFEPDPPNYTPRISGIVEARDGKMVYKLSILKSMDHNPASVQRFFFEYAEPVDGIGHMIHTYEGNGDPLPTFRGEPVPVALSGDIDPFTDLLWSSLHHENKVSLFVRYLNLQTGETEDRIRNKLEE